ncbi:MAG: flagellar hook protein FlgE [Alphaproteobacteria bacterium]
MSLYGAMYAGVSGLNAQSQAMSVISDNIANVNTTGYKATASRFSTLVTQQSLTHSYAPGGVLFNRVAQIDGQGLLQSSTSATDLAISGDGFFVVRGLSNAGAADPFYYTRAGSFTPDAAGFLRNTAGYYLMGWETDATGQPLNGNITALTSLEAVNVSGVAGTATPTTEISMGINLPGGAAVGDNYITNVQIYDSLGVTHDLAFNWTKNTLNAWGLDIAVPSGATHLTLTDASGDAYYAAARLDFASQPADGDTIVLGGVTYEFNSGGGVGAGNTAITIGADVASTVANLVTAANDPRITSNAGTLNFEQIRGWGALAVDASGASTITQSANGPFTMPAITVGGAVTLPSNTVSFSGQPADGDTFVFNGVTYEFDNNAATTGGNTAVTIGASAAASMAALVAAIGDPRVTSVGTAMTIQQTLAGAAMTADASDVTGATPANGFTVGAYVPQDIAAIVFSGANGAPASFNVANVNVGGWVSGAGTSNMALDLGTAGLLDGLTQFSSDYGIRFNNQNGVQFGTFSGVSIGDDGLVVALFDNGETLPIYKIPLATFANPNGMIAKTGNIFTASDTTGEPILRSAKNDGAGAIASGALENSTVDLGTEFTNMIVAQRAYSAATKIITTADEMLNELVNIKR